MNNAMKRIHKTFNAMPYGGGCFVRKAAIDLTLEDIADNLEALEEKLKRNSEIQIEQATELREIKSEMRAVKSLFVRIIQ